ncbi:hypothetical protein QN277_020045 [Acacia crassicarpa]|uniref:C2H2-type domain-containing protein n=1 Tax=Acacia crassicarpa TaxID=499986 RepID=A0AAE1JM43_9FABA|nr:hypothetical protein QN277_020045 [Acacia crassicarpa]
MNTEQYLVLDAEMEKAVPTTEKNEMRQTKKARLSLELKDIEILEMIEKERKSLMTSLLLSLSIKRNETNRGRLLMEQKDIKDLEFTEKEEVPEGKQFSTLQANTALESLNSNESSSSAIAKTEKMAADAEHGTFPHTSASENVQKEWTCAICQLTMLSDANLNSHVQGKKHKATCEALNTKTKATAGTDKGNKASTQVSASKKVQKFWTCEICRLTMPSEADLNSHLQGKKHKAACKALDTKTEATTGTDIGNKASTQVSASKKVQKIWTCEICQLTMLSEVNLNSHLQGKKHKAACKALNTKTKATTGTDIGNKASSQVCV